MVYVLSDTHSLTQIQIRIIGITRMCLDAVGLYQVCMTRLRDDLDQVDLGEVNLRLTRKSGLVASNKTESKSSKLKLLRPRAARQRKQFIEITEASVCS
jgi:hypothetical protein